MTVAARQRRVLSKIECMLGRTDPQLASKFGMFSRLASGEEMPWIEQVTASMPRRPGNMTRIGQLSYRLRVVLCVAVAAGALVTTLLAGGGAFARCAPVKAAQGYSLQSGGARHLAAPAAGQGLTAPVAQNEFHAGRQTKQRSTGVSNVNDLPARVVLVPGANGSGGFAAAMDLAESSATSGPPAPRAAAESWQEAPCAR